MINSIKKGMFVTLEGGEGSGKTTLIQLLKTYLESLGHTVLVTREPGGVAIAEQIRGMIMNNDMDSMTEALLFASARREHLVRKVIPALESGAIVICDRFVHSSLVYQGVLGGLGVDVVSALNEVAIGSYMPDFTLLLDIEPELGLQRISANSEREVTRFDKQSLDYHHRIRAGYQSMVSLYPEHNIKTIDASGNAEQVFEEGKKVFDAYFKVSAVA